MCEACVIQEELDETKDLLNQKKALLDRWVRIATTKHKEWLRSEDLLNQATDWLKIALPFLENNSSEFGWRELTEFLAQFDKEGE